jgi:hypothetical protein
LNGTWSEVISERNGLAPDDDLDAHNRAHPSPFRNMAHFFTAADPGDDDAIASEFPQDDSAVPMARPSHVEGALAMCSKRTGHPTCDRELASRGDTPLDSDSAGTEAAEQQSAATEHQGRQVDGQGRRRREPNPPLAPVARTQRQPGRVRFAPLGRHRCRGAEAITKHRFARWHGGRSVPPRLRRPRDSSPALDVGFKQ